MSAGVAELANGLWLAKRHFRRPAKSERMCMHIRQGFYVLLDIFIRQFQRQIFPSKRKVSYINNNTHMQIFYLCLQFESPRYVFRPIVLQSHVSVPEANGMIAYEDRMFVEKSEFLWPAAYKIIWIFHA